MNAAPVLHARFRYDLGCWLLSLEPEGGQALPERLWQPPSNLDNLGDSLFEKPEERRLLDRVWKLRIEPASGSPDAPLPGVPSWTRLRHPITESYLLELGWTISVLAGHTKARAGPQSVVVVEQEGSVLATTLRQIIPAPVHAVAVDGDASLSNAFVVVEPVLAADAASSLQSRAETDGASLVVWMKSVPPPSSVPEVIVVDHAEPAESMRWIKRLFENLRRVEPEEAFRRAVVTGARESVGKHVLRGAAHAWDESPIYEQIEAHSTRLRNLDRSEQDSMLKLLVANLLTPVPSYRIQVAVIPGLPRSGLEYFTLRAPSSPLTGSDRPLVDDVDIHWSTDPQTQMRALTEYFVRGKAPAKASPSWLAKHIAERAKEVRSREQDPSGLVLFWIRHHLLARGANPRGVRGMNSFAELSGYLMALGELSERLADEVRLLIHMPIEVPAPNAEDQILEELSPILTGASRSLRVDVLPTLDATVPISEVRAWARVGRLKVDKHTLETEARDSFDALLSYVTTLYPELDG